MNTKNLFLTKLFNFLFIFFLGLSLSSDVYASAAVEQRQRQMQKMQRQQQEASQQARPDQPLQASPQIPTISYEEKIVSMDEIWTELEISTEVWPELLDNETKKLIVDKYIQWFAQNGMFIRRSPQHYIDILDSMSLQQHPIFDKPFSEVLQFVAIIEYDFDNGQSPDAMVKELLGEQGYQQNKKRLKR